MQMAVIGRSSAIAGLVCGLLLGLSGPAAASQSWPGIRAELYGTRAISDGAGIVNLTAPDRPENQLKVPVAVEAAFKDGRSVKSVTLIVDENPTPVAAVFRFPQERTKVALATNFRFDAVTGVRAIVEASDGELYMTERHVRFTGGQAACSAPPNGSPEEIAAKMGKMELAMIGPRAVASHATQRVRLDLSHPNHTGMVKDQITLLYIPLLLVDRIDVKEGDETVVEMQGSMSFSQDPSVEFDFLTNGAEELTITSGDTSGARWTKRFPLTPAS